MNCVEPRGSTWNFVKARLKRGALTDHSKLCGYFLQISVTIEVETLLQAVIQPL